MTDDRFGLGVTAFALAISLASPFEARASGRDGATPHEHHLAIEWVTVPSLAELWTAASLIVVAHAVGRRQRPGAVPKAPPYTLTAFQVDRVVRAREGLAVGGAPIQVGARLEVEQLGGTLADGCEEAAEDDPLVAPGESDLLFLVPHEGQVGAYHVVGGFEGRLVLDAGRVRPLALKVHPQAALEVSELEGLPLDEALGRLRSAGGR